MSAFSRYTEEKGFTPLIDDLVDNSAPQAFSQSLL